MPESELVDQPTGTPTLKIQAVGFSGALVTLLVFVGEQTDIEIDATVAAALVTVLVSLAGYFKRNRNPGKHIGPPICCSN